MKRRWLVLVGVALLATLVSCGGGDGNNNDATPSPSALQPINPTAAVEIPQELTSASLPADQLIPSRFTCDGEDLSPALSWGAGPEGTRALVLIVQDIDVPGGFTHWLVYDIDGGARRFPEGVEKTERPANSVGGEQGRNKFGEVGYGGPCPPAGSLHRYEFTLSYLDSPLGLGAGAFYDDVLAAMEGHVLGTSSFTATYQR